MANLHLCSSGFFFLILCFVPVIFSRSLQNQETFIVHVSKSEKPALFSSHHHWHSSILESLSPSPHPTKLLYSYELAANGFSARITAAQAAELRRIPGVISVIPDRVRQLHTTRTPHFLGLADSQGLWAETNYADDVIIGVLDTGIWPERPSFSDEGLSPVPATWKGTCQTGVGFSASACNRKIIGARAYFSGYESAVRRSLQGSSDFKSARDTDGHGTHTASTAAGSFVKNASFFQYARGEARGMASRARIAAYKICWELGCYDSDILAAMDQAIADGVHIISLSVGSSGRPPAYYRDSIAIGAFGAMQHGVVVSCSAGNSGPGPYTAVNIAPWIITVGASTIDREFLADVILGDGRVFSGVSLYSGDPLGDSKLPLVYAGDCGDRYCYSGTLDSSKVAGKIVVCDRGGNARVAKGSAVKTAGGLGMILANTEENGEELLADSHLIPGTMIGEIAGNTLKDYIHSDPSPTATIVFRGTVIGDSPPAPRVAAFSSRGPNYRTAEILKPDVIAPGVNILAGWSGYSSPTSLSIDPRRVEFNIISGTSMSCPHVSGVAALLRKAFPTWSPAAIKSALVTTSYSLDSSGRPITDLSTSKQSNPFVHGAGHIDPNKALNPGLIYDLNPQDYVSFLCSIGYDSRQIAVFVKDSPYAQLCEHKLTSPGNLNYPSFAVVFDSDGDEVVKYTRTVTNVGDEVDAVYEVKVESPQGVEITVLPNKLEFSAKDRTQSYEITFTKINGIKNSASFGSIQWSDGSHIVRSPVAVSFNSGYIASM
ncbi:subtilisin-like protease SBT1.4 [Cucurbita moschata]|uniref:Subtilisin-like protease SBT1.4 n=1 Tax=Cucurbita moschata TaxID=3662 RepID=A0A6J1HMN7_CUCMO|nr:subtilisin-like protease SBT1.4 [Cucurbita moschata]